MLKSFLRRFLALSLRPTLAALLFGLLGGCAINPLAGGSELKLVNMTAGEEVTLGRSAYRRLIQKGGGRYRDSELSAYVDAVGQRLARQSHRPELQFSFALINDSVPNAFALPGGLIAITRGLLLNLSNEAELAALLGHQIGHVTARHSLQGLSPEDLQGSVGMSGGARLDSFGGVAAKLIDKRYSREQEAESDRLGIDYMVEAGYDPIGAVQLQEFFDRKLEAGADLQWLNGLCRSHPFSAESLAGNRRYIGENYPRVGGEGQDAVGFARAIKSLIQTRQGYATYDQARQMEKEGQLAEAINLYHRALLEAPDEALIMSSLGLAYLRSEDLVPARRYLIKAVNRQGDYYQSRLALGYVYQQKQQQAKARQQLETGFKLLPTLEGSYMLAEAREDDGDKEGARKLYEAVVKADAAGKLGRNAAQRLRGLGQ